MRDPLTGVMNQHAFYEHLRAAIDTARVGGSYLALLYLDVDHMKHFNVHNGYVAGDEVLAGLATALTSNRSEDRLVARVGGDKFAILLPGATELEAVECANRIREIARDALARPQPLNCGDKHCLGPAKQTVCLGVSILAPPMTADDLLRDAEEKVDLAKNSGGDCVCS